MEELLEILQDEDHNVIYKKGKPHPYFYRRYLEFLRTGEYPYLDDTTKFAKSFLPKLSETQEKNLVGGLSQIIFNPFEIETQDFDDFDNDSIVLKLSRPDELLQLHKKVVAVVRTYANAGFDAIAKQYFGDNYNPHLTISKSSSGFDRTSKGLIGRKDTIARYSLAKKLDGIWKEIQDFYSGG